ncbi:2-oxoadipate dehydrogenase complex component E1-like [Dysidea avara]|uniref:2-oxoadipate dehydrogenase complex component E1-like n=1 Tax=Dysidea avara TaxID=196820 RepID=UPI0033242737
MMSLSSLVARRWKTPPWLRLYHSTGCFGYRPNKGLISNATVPVNEEILANRIRAPNLWQLVLAYREHGHRMASLDPLAMPTHDRKVIVDPAKFGLEANGRYRTDGLVYGLGKDEVSLEEIIGYLERTYCGVIALEVSQVMDEVEREWLIQHYELSLQQDVPPERQLRIAKSMHKAETFDLFLAKKKPTLKRYGGEGAESMMAFFDELYGSATKAGITDVVIGMPHRGRVNLLTGALQVPSIALLHKINGWSEFAAEESCDGDILTHLTNSVDIDVEGTSLHVTMVPNPSHLEGVVPVIMGKTRSKQLSHNTGNYGDDSEQVNKVLCLQIHGDAALPAQGVIMETLSMANLPHFSVGGSVHLVVNNQLGFTTPVDQARSSLYCSDAVKMIGCPVIHVNGDYPEDVVRACSVALQYRNMFGKDVLVDMMCFRRRGHNEGDDPTFTQPSMYHSIDAHPGPASVYTRDKLDPKATTEVEETVASYKQKLEEELKAADSYKPPMRMLQKQWEGLKQTPPTITNWDTGCPVDLMKFVAAKSVEIPDGKTIHPRLMKAHVQDRIDSITKGTSLNWATAEAMAFGTLLCQGFNVRMSGQDIGRGTFSHRHVMLVDQTDGQAFVPLNSLTSDQTCFVEVVNSLLSEEGTVGFEYGFSIDNPKNLVIWEAQFGDFFNGAQLIIDTFVSTGEGKWQLQSGLVMMLPHGMDGMGPEHSSCRLERFLQCSDSGRGETDGDNVNWHIVNPTTPAQYFHLLRRQMIRTFRKPLIVASPKILLRHPSAVSSFNDMAPGTSFQHVLTDPTADPNSIKRVVFCSGKHYYTLDEHRTKHNITDTALIRLECLCPFPSGYIHQQLTKFSGAKEYIWAQEEAQNMGAWSFVEPRLRKQLGIEVTYRGRKAAGPPATGIKMIHDEQATQIVTDVFQ